MYGSIEETGKLKSYLSRLKSKGSNYKGAGITKTDYNNTLALAKTRIDIYYYKFRIACFVEKISCTEKTKNNIGFKAFTKELEMLRAWTEDRNILPSNQRKELQEWLEAIGLN